MGAVVCCTVELLVSSLQPSYSWQQGVENRPGVAATRFEESCWTGGVMRRRDDAAVRARVARPGGRWQKEGTRQDGGMGWDGSCHVLCTRDRDGAWSRAVGERGARHGYRLHAKDAVHLHACIPRNVNDIR